MQTEGFMGEKEEVLSKEARLDGRDRSEGDTKGKSGVSGEIFGNGTNADSGAICGIREQSGGNGASIGAIEPETALRLLAVKRELALRREDKLAAYNTGRKRHKKQIAFHKCKKRNRWVFGGNRTGKTECGAVEAVYMARGVHPYRKNRKNVAGWVVSLSQQVQRDVAQEKILSYLSPRYIVDIVMLSGRKDNPSGGIIDRIVVKNELGGTSTIGFKSCDQGREKFQGASLDFVWFDEEPPKDIYDECKMRVLDRRGDIFGTMTPLKGLTFVYDEIYLNERGDGEVWYEFMEWADNPFLSKREVEAYTKSLSSDQLESRRYGRFTEGSGPVYGEFDENVHVIDTFPIPPDWQDCVSIDPGLHNPLSAHFYAVDYDGNVYVVAEHFEAEKNVDYHAAKISEIAHTLGWKRDAKGRVEAYIDSAAGQHTLNGAKSVCELFYECGIAVNANVNKDLFSGIAQVKRYLKEGKLFIFKSCPNLIRELKAYRWQEGDRPRKEDDHALDELRYYLMTKPKKTFRPELPAAIREKERLIRLSARRRRNFS